ncbi:glycosyltransferase family 2 protein [Helicobacter saguini]|nr:glycosyltransferase family A protein [Helicobacter saguini]
MNLASENIKVAVIVPIFNVEQYLRECLDSIISQSYKNIEAILVNDGSTDSNSLNIAKEYVAKYSNFTLIDKPNLGLSSSRNVALDFLSQSYKLELDSKETKRVNEMLESKMQDSKEIQNLDSKNVNEPTAVLPTTILPTTILPTPQPPSAREGGYPYQDFKENVESNGEDSTLTPTHHTINIESNLLIYKVINENPYDIKAIYVNKDSIKNNTQLPTPLTPLRKGGGNSTQDSKDIESKTLQIPKIDYIIFLDSDDFWKSDCLQSCVNAVLQSEIEIAKLESKNLQDCKKDSINQNSESNTKDSKNTIDCHEFDKSNSRNDKTHNAQSPKRAEIIWFEWDYFYDGIEPPKEPKKTYHEIYGFKSSHTLSTIDLLKQSVKNHIDTFPFAPQGMIDFNFIKNIHIRFLNYIHSEDQAFGIELLVQSSYVYVLLQKPYVYRIRPNSSSNFEGKKNMKKEAIFPYLQDTFIAFNKDVKRTKAYFLASSWYLIFTHTLDFLNKYEKQGGNATTKVELAKKSFMPYIAYMATSVAKYPRDPKNLISGLPLVAPYLQDSKLKWYRKMAVYYPRLYAIIQKIICAFL